MCAHASVGRDLRILIVDDSVVYRRILKDLIGQLPGVDIVGSATNGRVALAKMEVTSVDFVVLDIEMPEMNGLEALEVIRTRWPDVGVVMVSGSSRSSADLTVEALARGAIDFVPKGENREQLKKHLGLVVRSFSTQWNLRHVRAVTSEAPPPRPSGRPEPMIQVAAPSSSPAVLKVPTGTEEAAAILRAAALSVPPPVTVPSVVGLRPARIDVVAIGTSTGGPQALAEVIPKLPGDLGVPVLVVQHMPPVFTASLARNLDDKSSLSVREGVDGDRVEPNVVYIAPGGYHMTVHRTEGTSPVERCIRLNEDPPENSCRPSVDVLFRSVASSYRGNTLAVVMTGMGDDGTRGIVTLKEQGCYCLTQDQNTCAVYGMPRVVAQAGLSDESLGIERIASRIQQLVARPRD
jgi:two-component system chemotaxis response regulator CheB